MIHANVQLLQDASHYPLHMVLSIVSPAAVSDILSDLETIGILSEHIDVAQGEADAQRMIAMGKHAWFEHIAELIQLGDDQVQRTRYVTALQEGHAVLFARLTLDIQKTAVAKALVQRGGYCINYYGRWIVETLHP